MHQDGVLRVFATDLEVSLTDRSEGASSSEVAKCRSQHKKSFRDLQRAGAMLPSSW
jgi:hypothetical protein